MATQQKIEEKVNDRMEKTEARIQRSEARETKIQHYFRHVLHIMEKLIAIFTLIVLLGAFAKLILELVHHPGSSADVLSFLHEVLTIVVGLEVVRMLIDTTPANILDSKPRRPCQQPFVRGLHCRTFCHPPVPVPQKRTDGRNGGAGVIYFAGAAKKLHLFYLSGN